MQDHFATKYKLLLKIQQKVVDSTRSYDHLRYTLQTPAEFWQKICEDFPAVEELIPRTTFVGWFVFAGKKAAPKRVVPNKTWVVGMSEQHNAQLQKSPGRPPFLGPEDVAVRDKFVADMKNYRNAGINVNIPVMRNILVSYLIDPKLGGFKDKLSPHLYSDSPPDPSKLMLTDYMMRCIIHRDLQWTWRANTKAAQTLPADWESQTEDMLMRIALLILMFDIPPELVFMADETFFGMQPHSRCVSIECTRTSCSCALPFLLWFLSWQVHKPL